MVTVNVNGEKRQFPKGTTFETIAKEYQKQYDSFIKDLTDSGYTQSEAEEYVNTTQINYLKATLTYRIASEWFIDQVFANQ